MIEISISYKRFQPLSGGVFYFSPLVRDCIAFVCLSTTFGFEKMRQQSSKPKNQEPLKFLQFVFTALIVLIFNLTYGQEVKDRAIGIYGSIEHGYSPSDKLRTAGGNRKIIIGARFSLKKYGLIGKVGFGLKASKFNLYPTSYQQEFLNELKQNYVPITTGGVDQIIAESMYGIANGTPEYNTSSSYNQTIHFGLIFEKIFLKPTISFNYGSASTPLKSPLISDSSDDFDYSFADGYNTYTEIRIGSAIPLSKRENPTVYLIADMAYQWYNYHHISYQGVPLSVYTTGDIASSYQKARHFYLSVSLIFWSR